MKRKPRFLVAALSAAITFGILLYSLGPRHFNHFTQCQSPTTTVVPK